MWTPHAKQHYMFPKKKTSLQINPMPFWPQTHNAQFPLQFLKRLNSQLMKQGKKNNKNFNQNTRIGKMLQTFQYIDFFCWSHFYISLTAEYGNLEDFRLAICIVFVVRVCLLWCFIIISTNHEKKNKNINDFLVLKKTLDFFRHLFFLIFFRLISNKFIKIK